MPTWPTYGSLVLPVLHGIRYQAPPGHSIARQLQTGAIQTTIFVSCLGALLETVVRVSWWHMNFLGHKQHTTATTRVSRHQTVKPCLLMMLVPLTLQTRGGPLRKNVQRVGLMFVTVSIKGTSCHRSCTLNFLKMSRASIPWFQILPSMAPHALLGIKSLVHLGQISVLLAQTGQVPILIGASCLGASLTSGALQGFQVLFLMVLWLTTAMTPVVTLQTATMTFPVTSAVPMTPMEPRATRYTRDITASAFIKDGNCLQVGLIGMTPMFRIPLVKTLLVFMEPRVLHGPRCLECPMHTYVPRMRTGVVVTTTGASCLGATSISLVKQRSPAGW